MGHAARSTAFAAVAADSTNSVGSKMRSSFTSP